MSRSLLRRLLAPTAVKRTVFFLGADLLVFALSMLLAFMVRFDGVVPDQYWHAIPMYLALAMGPKALANAIFRLYNLTWRFVSTREVVSVFEAAVVGVLAWGTLAYFLQDAIAGTSLRYPNVPRSILVLDGVLTFVGVGAVRVARRVLTVLSHRGNEEEKRVLVVGGGKTAERLIRELTHQRVTGYRTVGIVDDDPNKLGTYIHGVKVIGGRDRIPRVVKEERVDEVLVAMPSAAGAVVREVVVTARAAGVQSIRIMPGMADMLEGRVALASIREVQVEDLLHRAPVQLDMAPVGDYLFGRTVLVTGAAGSIGSELARQIARFEPGRLVLLDENETGLFGLELELRRTASRVALFPEMGDVGDRDRMRQVFRAFHPQVVFHAAAYKHVPMMEAHPQEAVTTNILGTKVVAEVAAEHGAEIFVLISTDKAVNPTSVMGCTKRVAEMVVRRLNETSATRFMAVRFGNVLGSRGSLVPILEEQIKRGGPITVTHPDMERYFMTVPESVRLILKAGSLGTGAEVFVLDMGEPVRILDLAEALIRLSGLEPDVDVPIQFTGIRPGEKLREEILMAEEGTDHTKVEQIYVARLGAEPDPIALERSIGLLADAAVEGDPARIRALLQDTVSTYRPAPGGETEEMFAEFLEAEKGSPE